MLAARCPVCGKSVKYPEGLRRPRSQQQFERQAADPYWVKKSLILHICMQHSQEPWMREICSCSDRKRLAGVAFARHVLTNHRQELFDVIRQRFDYNLDSPDFVPYKEEEESYSLKDIVIPTEEAPPSLDVAPAPSLEGMAMDSLNEESEEPPRSTEGLAREHEEVEISAQEPVQPEEIEQAPSPMEKEAPIQIEKGPDKQEVSVPEGIPEKQENKEPFADFERLPFLAFLGERLKPFHPRRVEKAPSKKEEKGEKRKRPGGLLVPIAIGGLLLTFGFLAFKRWRFKKAQEVEKQSNQTSLGPTPSQSNPPSILPERPPSPGGEVGYRSHKYPDKRIL